MAITIPTTMLLLPSSSVDSLGGVIDVMVMTSERVGVLGFTEGAVGVEEGINSYDKGSGGV